VVANGGLVPIGYYKDPEKSARTFREVNGHRYSFPGDMATIAADGTLVLFGRGSNCINTGGEKVYPEEVEEALKVHPAVEDALVFGVSDDRFGQRVVGIVSLTSGESAVRARSSPMLAVAWPATSSRRNCASWTRCRGHPTARPIIRRPVSSSVCSRCRHRHGGIRQSDLSGANRVATVGTRNGRRRASRDEAIRGPP